MTGLIGHPEQSGFPFSRKGWIGGLDYRDREVYGGEDWFPYEQVAYYLDGALRCGYLVNNAEMKRIAKDNIDYMLSTADKNGQLRLSDIEDDWWPLVVFIRMMAEEYENTKDPKLLDALSKHYKATYADDKGTNFVFSGFASRSLLHVEHLCWLYGETQDKWFIQTAEKLYSIFESRNKKPSSVTAKGMNQGLAPAGHSVTYHEFLKLPSTLYYYTGKEYYRTAFEKAYKMLNEQHEMADGLSSSVEFLSGNEEDSAHELCNSIDFNWTAGWAMLATCDASYGDKIEKSLYNAGMASITSDFKAHQYYGTPNLLISSDMSSDYNDKTSWAMHGKKRLCFRPGHDTECCTGNIHRMLPTFINRSSMTNEKGVMINFYIPGTTSVNFKGQIFRYSQNTNYPFEFKSVINIMDNCADKMEFGLRIPSWATKYTIKYNGAIYKSASSDAAQYQIVESKFKKGDVIEIEFTTQARFEKTANGTSICYGPLVYSYEIESTCRKTTNDGAGKCSEEFPAYQFYPKNPNSWAYAIEENSEIKVLGNKLKTYPWDRGASPIILSVQAKKVKNWKLREWTYITKYPKELELEEKIDTIKLTPCGGTILRISDFPICK